MRALIIIILVSVISVFAEVKYKFRDDYSVFKVKSQKSKSDKYLLDHKISYFNYLERIGLNYIIDWKTKVDAIGDTIKYVDETPYNDKVNLTKIEKFKQLGLRLYSDKNEFNVMQGVARINEIDRSTLLSTLLAYHVVFTGTVISSESPFYPISGYNTKVGVEVDEILKGSYYFDKIPKIFQVFCHYGHQPEPKDFFKAEDFFETYLKKGVKYLFMARKTKSTGSRRTDINNLDVVINDQVEIYTIENNNIIDKKWSFKMHTEINKLHEFIKHIELINDTENFFNETYK